MSTVPNRSEIDETYTWAIERIFETDEAWETAFEEAEQAVDALAELEQSQFDDADTLLAVVQTYEDVMRQVQQVGVYARLRRDEDTRDQKAQARLGRVESLQADAGSAGSFIEPAILETGREQIEAFIDEKPALEEYEHRFDDVLRQQDHTRSAEVEELLADLSEVTGGGGDVYSMLTNADMTFPSVEDPDGDVVEISLSNFTTLQKHPSREFRREVYETFYDEWADVRNAVASAYDNSVTSDVKLAQARNYDTAREAALDGPNIPVEVYDTLVDTVRDNLDVLHRHADLKRQSIGADELRMWDLYVPTADGDGPELPYEEAADYVIEAVGALGDDYQQRVADGIDSRWVDVYENEGKRSGAYSSGTYDTQPYILMNYQDDVSSMYTLAHELGHSLHSQFTNETQPYVYSDYEIFVAEVASTVNEALLTDHLLSTVEDEQLRRHVLSEYAPFDSLYKELKGAFYEPAAVDDRIGREWMRIPHFYRAYYVYQYSTGISAAVAIADDILTEGEPAAERYHEFLRSGSSDYPLELLDIAGVDMRDSDPIERAIGVYDEHLDELEALL